VPWELAQFGCEDETLDMLQADLQTRVPFRDLPVHWRRGNGKVRHFVVSGEPRFNDRGMFSGYWGVARDVTADVQARQALAATEGRYQELFSRIPTPLVLHRNGRVIDANAAGVALFGYDTLGAMLGRDLLASYESGDSRERERRRIEELDRRPPGEGLPVTDFRLTGRAGRRVSVRATGVRVDADDGPAMLSIYVDDTERRAAEDAVRRSEAMLSHLVATSPDVITLTDLVTGRYVMVNQTFERLTGYAAAEVVGHTSVELGIWHRPEQRIEFVALVQRDGAVKDLPVEYATKGGRTVAMLVSGARFADGPARVPRDQCTRRVDHRARAARARGHSRHCLDRHRVHAREPLRARQPLFRAHAALARGHPQRAARPRGLGERTTTMPRPAPRSGRP
jgi:PAS domain S-box-containing protein